MDKQIEKLVEYQEIDKKLKAIEDEVVKSEDSQKFLSAKKFLDTVNDSIAVLENKSKSILDTYNNTLVEIANLKNVANDYLKNVEACESEDELNYLKKKFQSTIEAVANLENKLNQISKEMVDVLKEFNKLSSATKQMKEQYTEYGPKFKKLKEEKDKEMAEIKGKLEVLKSNIKEDLMQKYLAKRKDKKFPIIYAVNVAKGSYCPACATGMSKVAVDELISGEIKECESCRTLLYAVEKS